MRDIKGIILGLALAENGGDVQDEVAALCELFDLGTPVWSDDYDRFILPWEEEYPPE